MNEYQKEQWDGQRLVRRQFRHMAAGLLVALADQVAPYLAFRIQVDQFLNRHCSRLCTESCFLNRKSACCSRDGIITFWADLVVNAICSDIDQLKRLEQAIQSPLHGHKCIYLGSGGCLWQVRPLVCAMFLCDSVKTAQFEGHAELGGQWIELNRQAKGFRWPDRPVLFDKLETPFIERGCQSPLMYLNNSPGLLRIKQQSGLI